MTYTEGPGILFVRARPLLSDADPGQSIIVTIDEKYLTDLFAAKFALTIAPRKERL